MIAHHQPAMTYDLNAPRVPQKVKSPARIAAGSRNGKLGAGKKSAAGLAVSSRNAVKHGYWSQSFTILATESQSIYDDLRDSLREVYSPANLPEQRLVEEIAQQNWLVNRTFNMENAYLNQCIAEVVLAEDAPDDSPVNVVAATVDGFKRASHEAKPLTLIYRQRAQAQRERARAIKAIETLIAQREKSARHAAAPPLRAQPIPLQTNPLTQSSSNEGNE
jgi:hypothetical protein